MLIFRLLSVQGALSESVEHAVNFMSQLKIRLMLESISLN